MSKTKEYHLQYWYNPSSRELHCLEQHHHNYIVTILKDTFDFDFTNLETYQIINKIVDMGWVRLTYDPRMLSLSLQCLRNKDAIRALNAIEHQEHLLIISAFIDISDYVTQNELDEDQLAIYRKTGKVR